MGSVDELAWRLRNEPFESGGFDKWSLEGIFDAERRAPHERQLSHHVRTLEAHREQREILRFGKTLVAQAGEKILSRDELTELRSTTERAVFSLAIRPDCGEGLQTIGPSVRGLTTVTPCPTAAPT